MNILNNPSLMDQLAASYALGTLRGGARRRFEALARDNATLRAAALIWQSRLASVAELQQQAAPSPAVWQRIENLVNAEKQARAMQAARAAPVAAAAAGGWWASLGRWRGATATGAFRPTGSSRRTCTGACRWTARWPSCAVARQKPSPNTCRSKIRPVSPSRPTA
jgi:anti-sigma-K factor RskA